MNSHWGKSSNLTSRGREVSADWDSPSLGKSAATMEGGSLLSINGEELCLGQSPLYTLAGLLLSAY